MLLIFPFKGASLPYMAQCLLIEGAITYWGRNVVFYWWSIKSPLFTLKLFDHWVLISVSNSCTMTLNGKHLGDIGGANVMWHWLTTMSQVCKKTKKILISEREESHDFLSFCTLVTLWLANVTWHWHPDVTQVLPMINLILWLVINALTN